MRVDELIANRTGPLFSVELWPPRSPAAEARLETALGELSRLRVDFASITYGAGGSTREHTHELVVRLRRDYGLLPVAHLVTAAHTREDLEAILERYTSQGIVNLLALRGDPPLESTGTLAPGELAHAIDLARLASEKYSMCVGVAAHPEGHPEAPGFEADMDRLAEKLEVADYAITQFFYTADRYARLRDALAKRGVDKPVLPGIMAPTSLSTLKRMAELSGASIPAGVASRLERYEDDPAGFQAEGTQIAIELCTDLLAMGVEGLHVFTMNQAATTVAIHEAVFGSQAG
ncbi:MAG: methylenetetrahydrofolate reductase [Actinomycetota bacterium]|nr:methylenetetrahydrofolate reductase [Actinomycetota bacterium]